MCSQTSQSSYFFPGRTRLPYRGSRTEKTRRGVDCEEVQDCREQVRVGPVVNNELVTTRGQDGTLNYKTITGVELSVYLTKLVCTLFPDTRGSSRSTGRIEKTLWTRYPGDRGENTGILWDFVYQNYKRGNLV